MSMSKVRTKHLFARAVPSGVFGAGWGDPVRLDWGGGFWYLILRVFWLLLPKSGFSCVDRALGYKSTQI